MSLNEPNRVIGFLKECKVELSAEVVKWKEENHKLQEEKQTYEQKIRELQFELDQLKRQNVELEANLLSSKHDYEKLEMHSLAINEENKFLHRKLSSACSKYFSYPLCDFDVLTTFPFRYGSAHQKPNVDSGGTKSWEKVSEKLIQQMRLEMKELNEIGQKLAINELSYTPNSVNLLSYSVKDHHECHEQCSNERSGDDNCIADLACDLLSLKEHLTSQHQKLSLLLSQASSEYEKTLPSGDAHNTKKNVPNIKEGDSVSNWVNAKTSGYSEKNLAGPSDDHFRAYFTEQLANKRKSTEEFKCMMDLNSGIGSSKQNHEHGDSRENLKSCAFNSEVQQNDEHRVNIAIPHCCESCFCSDEDLKKPVMHKSHPATKTYSEEERVCPICEVVFPRVFSQSEFESHVIAHLEAESTSLFDAYEILL